MDSVWCFDCSGADSSGDASCHAQHQAVLYIGKVRSNLLCGLGEESQEDTGAHRTGALDGGVKSLYKLTQPLGKTWLSWLLC